eukprot:CAMPEP_0195297948 /NCGR_PEP_ID=MMETSP0707-20130614/22448_1 /TAXON_ID=33640 /ORGANISM="Asterionellopsis glacialis, Strain CCMP134" /LENGTH=273 /DNA_ID=CAMNT_0040359889 /DNA_START=3 /DNA_END=821 /DNA_ORIENTATION=+
MTDLPLSTVRSLLRGRCIVVEGGQITAEAREPDRKRRLHEQLRCARRLRGVMENAAERAEVSGSQQQAKQILISNTPHIKELVSLTEAVRGGYTLDSYREENLRAQQQEQEDRQRAKDASATLHSHLQAMANERDGVVPLEMPLRKKLPTKKSKKNLPTKSTENRSAVLTSKSAAVPSADVELGENDTHSNISRPKKKNSRSRSRVPTGKPSSVRKCHYCKDTKINFRRCHFWFGNGSKCGKTFCDDCLVQRFHAESVVGPDGVRVDRNDTDW